MSSWLYRGLRPDPVEGVTFGGLVTVLWANLAAINIVETGEHVATEGPRRRIRERAAAAVGLTTSEGVLGWHTTARPKVKRRTLTAQGRSTASEARLRAWPTPAVCLASKIATSIGQRAAYRATMSVAGLSGRR